MNSTWDVSLYGDSLKEWRQWVESLERQEWLTRWAIRANKGIVAISMPFWMASRIIGIPLMFIDVVTLFWLGAPLRSGSSAMLHLVLWSSDLWIQTPALRPALLLIQPLLITTTMVLISVAPEEPDIRDTKYILSQLWPLSRSRLRWIAEHGSGKEEKVEQTNVAGHSEAQQEEALKVAWGALAQTKSRRHWGISREFALELIEEFKGLKIIYEPPRKQLAEADVDGLFNLIAASDELTLKEKAVGDFALLAALEGSVPTQRGLSCLKTVFGDEFVEAILAKQGKSTTENH